MEECRRDKIVDSTRPSIATLSTLSASSPPTRAPSAYRLDDVAYGSIAMTSTTWSCSSRARSFSCMTAPRSGAAIMQKYVSSLSSAKDPRH